MDVYGLTGGIGSGKSTVADLLEEYGIPVVSADELSRIVVSKGSEGLRDVVARFGPTVVDEVGELDRRKLASIVFGDPAQRRELEAILHPRIRERFEQVLDALEKAGHEVAVYEVPLLFEKNLQSDMKAVVLVTAPDHIRVARVRARDDVTETEVRARIAAQMDESIKRRRADYVIENDGTPDDLRREVEFLLARFLRIESAMRRALDDEIGADLRVTQVPTSVPDGDSLYGGHTVIAPAPTPMQTPGSGHPTEVPTSAPPGAPPQYADTRPLLQDHPSVRRDPHATPPGGSHLPAQVPVPAAAPARSGLTVTAPTPIPSTVIASPPAHPAAIPNVPMPGAPPDAGAPAATMPGVGSNPIPVPRVPLRRRSSTMVSPPATAARNAAPPPPPSASDSTVPAPATPPSYKRGQTLVAEPGNALDRGQRSVGAPSPPPPSTTGTAPPSSVPPAIPPSLATTRREEDAPPRPAVATRGHTVRVPALGSQQGLEIEIDLQEDEDSDASVKTQIAQAIVPKPPKKG